MVDLKKTMFNNDKYLEKQEFDILQSLIINYIKNILYRVQITPYVRKEMYIFYCNF